MKIVVGVATYNEAQNIERLVEEIHSHLPNQRVLIIDDNSPDGTGKVIEKMMENDPYLRMIHRPGKMGLGSAHIVMMKYAMENDFDALITMDADFSHAPSDLPTIAEHLKNYDFVIGSRYIEGGKSHYGFYRTLISKVANWGAQKMAGIPLCECTTAYRGFRVELLRKVQLNEVRSNGYSFMVEMLYHVVQHTNKLKEFPIEFVDRVCGKSKINKKEMVQSALTLVRLWFDRRKKKQQ
ncbi:MAG: polyprenol monophosphomannose synthase [Oligoflexia bacterium]|nr:polyprenol monophosphomannose synthase [Oligoflexia bacterium]MBF0366202.1 polyprenol monophosphomannose synthase [Oligoflexia bacterium]